MVHLLNEALDKLIQDEIDKGVEQYKEDYEYTKEQLNIYKSRYGIASQEIKQLRQLYKQMDEFNTFKGLINKDNIEEVISRLQLNYIDINFNGMDSERIPVWFKLVCTYYNDKEKLFTLMDMFNIEYPHWAKSFKMPFDYNEEYLDLVFEHLGKMYVCNGEIFNNNMGFFFQYQNKYSGDLNSLFNSESYVEIPWNLLLQSPLLTTEKYFDKIIDALKNKRSHSEYFFKIQDYQELTDEQVNRMVEYLPIKNFYDYHRDFINHNKDIFKHRPDLAETFKDKISDNHYSTFYFLNYPIEMQKEFVKDHSDRYNSYGFDLVKKMDIPEEEKLELLNQIATNLLNKLT